MRDIIEQVIKKNLPEKKETCTCEEDIGYHTKECNFLPFGFNDCLSQINTSLIADEVLKVVRKITKKLPIADHRVGEPNEKVYWEKDILRLLSTLSPNKENKNNDGRI